MADRRIDDQVPEEEEQDGGREFDPLGEGTGDQGRCDDGEGQLIGDPEELRQAGGQTVGRGRGDAVQEGGLQTADEAVGGLATGAEGQAVAGDEPEHGDDDHGRGGMGDGRQDVLAPHHAAVEQGQTGQGHQQDQGRRGQDPGRRRLVQLQRGLMRQQGRGGGRCCQGGAGTEQSTEAGEGGKGTKFHARRPRLEREGSARSAFRAADRDRNLLQRSRQIISCAVQ